MSSRVQNTFLLSDSGQLREFKLTKTCEQDVEVKNPDWVIRRIINESVIRTNQLNESFIKDIRVDMNVKKKLTGVLVKDEEK